MQDTWPQSKTAMLGAAGMNQQSKISDIEIQAIANMMDETPHTSESGIPVLPPTIGGPQFEVSPKQAAELMIQNYVKNNGGTIIDNNRSIQSGVILG